MQEACGVFGCVAKGPWPSSFDVAETVVTGLMGLQHRGQESAGIVTSTGENTHDLLQHKGMGLVDHVFKDVVHLLPGNLALGHTRYSTAGCSSIVNCQPFVVETMHGKIAIAHNGELFNTKPLKEKILRNGIGLTTGSDTELITQLLCQPPSLENENGGPNWVIRIEEFMKQSHLSYSLVILHKDRLLAMRDPFGNRPLCIGEIFIGKNGKLNEETLGWVVSSESCSLASVGAEFHSSVKPGEIVEISGSGVRSLHIVARPQNKPAAFCIFEYVYFARPDSFFEGQMVDTVRERCGRKLAMEFPVYDADIITTVPESAAPAAVGYANQLGIPHEAVLCKNRYVGRTFIKPSSRLRKLAVAMKFGVLKDKVVGKKIVLVDDSIVRGNTMGPIVSLLKKSGALQVHIRIASPPIKHPCYMGINIPTREELIANQMSLLEMETYLGADSVRYLSLEGLIESSKTTDVDSSDGGYCTACLNGCYPVDLDW